MFMATDDIRGASGKRNRQVIRTRIRGLCNARDPDSLPTAGISSPVDPVVRPEARSQGPVIRSPRWVLPRSLQHAVLAALPILGCTGCCDLSRYLCGPEESEWISESFTTPARTIATVKEAFRRDDHVAIFGCFSQRLRAELGVQGTTDTFLALEELNEQTPGLHMLGYAELQSLEPIPDGRRRAVLEVRGRQVELLLVQQAYWQLAWLPDGEDGEARDEGGWLRDPAELRRFVSIVGDDFESSVTLRLTDEGPEGLRLDQIRAAGIAVEWKVDGFELLGDGS